MKDEYEVSRLLWGNKDGEMPGIDDYQNSAKLSRTFKTIIWNIMKQMAITAPRETMIPGFCLISAII